MFVSRNNRTVSKGQLVAVHFNSHRKTYSIVSMKSLRSVGLVLGYSDSITLINCYTKIDNSGQKNVRKCGTKNRHAYIVGYLESFQFEQLNGKVYYNPHKYDNFVDYHSKEYLKNVQRVSFKTEDNKSQVVYQ